MHTYPIEKIVVNTSFGKLATNLPEFNEKALPEIRESFGQITGQKPQDQPARISISGFKLREGSIIGLKATLRRRRAMQFLDRVVSVVLPRIRDFRGISLTSVDPHGNLTFGVREHTVFPEIVLEKARFTFGIEITIVPKGNPTREEAVALYRKLGIPLQKEETKKGKK